MLKKLLNKKLVKNEKGLTLIELLAVIVILGIIAAIATPSISNIINTQRDKALLADASTMISAAKVAHSTGACAANPTGDTSDDLCSKTELEPFVEGIALQTGDQVQYTARAGSTAAKWEVTRTMGKAIKTEAIKTALGATYLTDSDKKLAALPESKLNEVLGK